MHMAWSRVTNWLARVPPASEPVTVDDESLDELVWQARRDVEAARSYFESVSEPELVDYACYLLEAAQKRYSYLLRLIRSQQS